MKAHPAWASWCKLVELFSRTIQHEFTMQDIQDIDNLQLEYTHLFNQVPEYNAYMRPKHHFLTHIALDIWRFGPPRGYWCFGFEGFNKMIKRGTQQSHMKGESVSCMKWYSMCSCTRFAT
jgi:hypothetical protein